MQTGDSALNRQNLQQRKVFIMACTTILVGKGATNDCSTIIARNEDCENGDFNAKSMVVVTPEEQPRTYTDVNSHLTIELPDNPVRYICTPNTDPSDGVWGEAGINAANVSMSATETISSNARVLGADPLVTYQPATDGSTEKPGGIGEEDLITIILPYIKTAREGVTRMGGLLEKYGTYEMNGVAFGDSDEVWYIETIGGHHWIARRVPDDCYVAQPNKFGIDRFDLDDAYGAQTEYMCSSDLAEWMAANQLDVTYGLEGSAPDDKFFGVHTIFNPRQVFGSYTQLDIIYNNPRAWYIYSVASRSTGLFTGADAKYGPESMDIPWCMKPDAKLSAMDVKNILSSNYDGTIYDPYDSMGTPETRRRYRNIGINRTCECSVLQIRGNAPKAVRGVQWVSFGSGTFNTSIAMLSNVKKVPDYLATTMKITPEKFYWANRLIAGLADPEYFDNMQTLLTFQQTTMAEGYEHLHAIDEKASKMSGADDMDDASIIAMAEESNQELCDFIQKQNDDLLASALYTRSMNMKNAFNLQDH